MEITKEDAVEILHTQDIAYEEGAGVSESLIWKIFTAWPDLRDEYEYLIPREI